MVASRIGTLIAIVVVSTISAWVTAYRMRRRARKALGRDIRDSELTSLNTWMEIEEAEKRKPLGQ